MTDGERPAFGAAEVITITSKFEADDDAFIIGGQATNFWAWFYQDAAPEDLKGPFTSEDIDYFGSEEVARHVAAAPCHRHALSELRYDAWWRTSPSGEG
jgi:hypothetical protein